MKVSKIILRATLLFSLAFFLFAQNSFAQDRGEAGIYGEYFRLLGLRTNLAGVGGRVSLNLFSKQVQTEAELGYLFSRSLSSEVMSSNSSIRILHGMFGPKYTLYNGAIKPFVTLKAGFFNTEINGGPPVARFGTLINNLRRKNITGTFYPGTGLETSYKNISFRLDVGDEIVYNPKTNHNLRVTFGPQIRF